MKDFAQKIGMELMYIEEAFKYLKTTLGRVNTEHIQLAMREKILGVIEALTDPAKLSIAHAATLQGISLTEQAEFMIWLDDIEKRNRHDLESLLHREKDNKEETK